ncbi:hypothetical protein [Natrinema caseinilyticum]|uniref:hypothetical protein n=1 Tax=Natrinema caseinilyticum TaxID=2961570 RepID=UPI0020C53992|nr:hypothetical protein [Natrinema caseinilyticum]
MVERIQIGITIAFIIIAIALFFWGQSTEINSKALYALLIGVGVIIPTIITSILSD